MSKKVKRVELDEGTELKYGTKEYFKSNLDSMNLDQYIENPSYLSTFTIGMIENRLKDYADAGGDITPYVKKYEKIKEKNTEYFQSLSEEDQEEYIQRNKDRLQRDMGMKIFPGQRELGIVDVPMETDSGVIIPVPEKDIFDIEGFKDNYGYRTDVATGGLIKRVGLRGGRDAAQSDFSPGPGAVTSDAGFENDSPSQVTSINIKDAPTIFDIKKTGDPSLNPKSKNQRDDDRFSGYTPSFVKPSIFKRASNKAKSFVNFAKPFFETAILFGAPIPSNVRKGIGLFRTFNTVKKAIPIIKDKSIQDELISIVDTDTGGINPTYTDGLKNVTMLDDGREDFRFGSRGYQGSRASGVQRPGFSAPSRQGQSPRGSSFSGGGRKSKPSNKPTGSGGKTPGPKGQRGGSTITITPGSSKRSKNVDRGFQLAKLAALGLDVGTIANTPTTTIYSGTTSTNPFGGKKFFATPDLATAKTYATSGPFRGSVLAGPVTGKVLSAEVPTSQVKDLTKRGLTLSRELTLDPKVAKEVFTKGSGAIKGAGSIGTKIAQAGFRAVPGVGTGISLADAASRFGKGDFIGGALSVAGAVPGVGIPALGLQVGYDAFKDKLGLKDGGQPKKIPIRSNKYGVKELDYRKSGGFVPIGVKEKADDVPAMLSKNEFVFTADAVRGAGNGSINKGAQRMYNLMKNLEARRA